MPKITRYHTKKLSDRLRRKLRKNWMVSAPVMIDNTPPVVTLGEVRRTGATAHVEWDATDKASALRRCKRRQAG